MLKGIILGRRLLLIIMVGRQYFTYEILVQEDDVNCKFKAFAMEISFGSRK